MQTAKPAPPTPPSSRRNKPFLLSSFPIAFHLSDGLNDIPDMNSTSLRQRLLRATMNIPVLHTSGPSQPAIQVLR
ncbi:hypothetical protein NLJ89_g9948 [Agrocybe chaxingu]|uniref:Uncharacterized protein n=1 Tax=Agrocybe chaxingu TaxID=84603 RepID=A0A9W8JS89_9AGAR|nr:hypothetical protein NLJ89_g9948 [Agrocybe chaxingu]